VASKRSIKERAPLGRALITSTAAEMIAEVGVDKLTMRAVAGRLGVSAMALYHHVEDKDELVRMVGDDLLRNIKLPNPDSGDCRERLMSVVMKTNESLLTVPGLSSVLLTSKLLPNARTLLVFCLHQFERGGLDRDAAQEAYAAVQQLALGWLLVADSPTFRLSPMPHPDNEIRDYMMKLRSPATFEAALSALLDHYLPPSRRPRSRRRTGS
jgi:TetR/AcrR family transcriptional regulator, tetracycline repressor protein